jgi:predicted metalloprotease
VKWRRTQSEHVDDLRGQGRGIGAGGLAAGGGLAGIIALLAALFLGIGGGGGGGGSGGGGIGDILGQLGGAAPQAPNGQVGPQDASGAPPATKESEFVTFLTEDVQKLWDAEFRKSGKTYRYARVNLFTGRVQSGCGVATSAVGPFYCPADSEVYIDLDFFRELTDRFGAPGDFAQAYVVAHEIGHHVQNLLGISDEVRQEEQGARSRSEANRWSVKLELQADCLAGVWAHSVYARGDLEPGDVEEGLAAAQAVGDDRIQAQAGVSVDPDQWTHGSAEQRQHWFTRGFESGRSDDCDTFS